MFFPVRRVLGCILLFSLRALPLCAAPDTVSVYFPFNEYALSERERAHMDSALYNGKLSATRSLQIIGYADAVGGNGFNDELSRNRAVAVKNYLLQSGFRSERITLIVGKGEVGAAAEQPGGNLPDRRVDIVELAAAHKLPQNTTTKFKLSTTVPLQISKVPAGPLRSSSTNISQVKVGETLIIDNIYFYAGRHFVRKESDSALDALVAALREHPEVKIRIEGHVCCVPVTANDAIDDDTGKEELSLNRAEVIRNYLLRHGIAGARLSYVGFGHRVPLIFPEHNEAEANQNRRVEIRVMP